MHTLACLNFIDISLFSYLNELASQIDQRHEKGDLHRTRQSGATCEAQSPILEAAATAVPSLETCSFRSKTSDLLRLAISAAKRSAPVASAVSEAKYPVLYYTSFFMDAELPFPLAFQNKRAHNLPCVHDGSNFTQLPEEVVKKLMNLYLERILPQYPIFSRHTISCIFDRFKASDIELSVLPEEGFMTFMCLAIATLSCKSKDYRRLVAMAESLRRDAFSCIELSMTCNDATTTTLQQLLLLAQYGFLLPSTMNLWQIVGDAAMIAMENGLHQIASLESEIHKQVDEERNRLHWTVSMLFESVNSILNRETYDPQLYVIERSVAITSHRPFAVAEDQIHRPVPSRNGAIISGVESYQNADTNSSLDQIPHIEFIDRLQFLKIQSEICSVNIGMRPIADLFATHEEWYINMQERISNVQAMSATPKWSRFMELHSVLLLNMPCIRNPHPKESQILKYVAAAIQIVQLHWDLCNSENLNYPWHATHHSYEAGNLLLYGIWHYRSLILTHYSISFIFEIVQCASSVFVCEHNPKERKQDSTLLKRL